MSDFCGGAATLVFPRSNTGHFQLVATVIIVCIRWGEVFPVSYERWEVWVLICAVFFRAIVAPGFMVVSSHDGSAGFQIVICQGFALSDAQSGTPGDYDRSAEDHLCPDCLSPATAVLASSSTKSEPTFFASLEPHSLLSRFWVSDPIRGPPVGQRAPPALLRSEIET